MTNDFPYINRLTGEGSTVCVSGIQTETCGGTSSECVCNYLLILQAALCFYDELDVLAGESHQFAVAGPQSNVL